MVNKVDGGQGKGVGGTARLHGDVALAVVPCGDGTVVVGDRPAPSMVGTAHSFLRHRWPPHPRPPLPPPIQIFNYVGEPGRIGAECSHGPVL